MDEVEVVGTSNAPLEDSLASSSSESSSSSSVSRAAVGWRPSQLAFTPYSPPVIDSDAKPHHLRLVLRRPLLARLTKDILETYQISNPQFRYSEELNPKRFLTSPSVGVLNNGYDNANSDLILNVNFVLVNIETQRRYVVKDILGHGTFGQVAKCWVAETKSYNAVKIIKNQPAYYQQALVEVSILTTLNRKFDPEDKHHIVRIFDYFVYQRHLCIAFEVLNTNLYELIKINHFRGLSLSIVQLFSKQILHALTLMKDASIIHCDLKPENILLSTSVKPAEIKIIDFGSACMEDRTVYSYIQSRYYRSPEVLLGYQYTTAIDMWSFGCIVAELFLGLPLFPGASEFDLLKRMIKILGGQPPDYVLKDAKNTGKFFKCVSSINNEEQSQVCMGKRSAYQALTEEEYEARELKKPLLGKEYFNHMDLEAIVNKYPYRKNLTEEDISKESQVRLALIDFLRGLVEFDPAKRWSPLQASKHPFVTGQPFTCPFKPPPETPRLSVSQNVKVDHHPAGGHWFAAGLSPNIPGRNRVAPPHNSPHFPMMPYIHGGSFGSLGSHGTYNDGNGLGSYGDSSSNMLVHYSPVGSGMKFHPQGGGGMSFLGTSPDTARRIIQLPGDSGGLGISPSAGNFAPMSLGTSPSQFTPPSPYSQISAAVHYGPTSPARGTSHGSPLGKMATVNQLHRRKNWGQHSGGFQSQDSKSSRWQQQQQGKCVDGTSPSQSEGIINSAVPPGGGGGGPVHFLSHSNAAATWKQQQQGGSGITSAGCSLRLGSNIQTGDTHENSESNLSLPDPGDWDPNYSEELLLEEDGGNNTEVRYMAAEFGKGMHLGGVAVPPTESLLVGVRRFNQLSDSMHHQHHRPNGPTTSQNYSYGGPGEVGGSSAADLLLHVGSVHNPMMMMKGSPPQAQAQHFMAHPHFAQSSPPSRLGQQQPVQRLTPVVTPHGRPATVVVGGGGGDWNHHFNHHHHVNHHPRQQPPPPSTATASSYYSAAAAPGKSSLSNGMSSSWGGGGGGRSRGNHHHHPVPDIPPASSSSSTSASRGRKGYGRIA